MTAEELLLFLQEADAFRRKERWQKVVAVYQHVLLEDAADDLVKAYEAACQVDVKKIAAVLHGKEIAEKVKVERVLAIKRIIKR